MREAAHRTGVPETTYREWEYGRQIRGEPYRKIAEAFNISVGMLFGEEEYLTLGPRPDLGGKFLRGNSSMVFVVYAQAA